MPLTSEDQRDAQTVLVLRMLAQGQNNVQIAEALGITARQAAARIKEVVDQAREDAAAHVKLRFTQHDERCEYLYRCCLKRINSANLKHSGEFDDKAIRAAVAVLDRQARLLGLDRTANTGGQNFNVWLDNQSGADLERLARQYGIEIPRPFATDAG
jgi:hypothetical protein